MKKYLGAILVALLTALALAEGADAHEIYGEIAADGSCVSPLYGYEPVCGLEAHPELFGYTDASQGYAVPTASGSIESYIHAVFGAEGAYAVEVARCESQLIAGATGDLGEVGIFQILPSTAWGLGYADHTVLYDPYENIRAAKELRDQAGWSPTWTCAA
jgi:hypothetical protein